MLTNQNTSFVIYSRKKDRFFYRFKNNKCYTSWSMAGAKHFLVTDRERVTAICKSMKERGHDPLVMMMGVITPE